MIKSTWKKGRRSDWEREYLGLELSVDRDGVGHDGIQRYVWHVWDFRKSRLGIKPTNNFRHTTLRGAKARAESVAEQWIRGRK